MSNPAMPLAHIVDDDEAIRDALSWLFRTRNVAARAWPSAEDFLAAWQPLLHAERAKPEHKGLIRWAIDVDPLAI